MIKNINKNNNNNIITNIVKNVSLYPVDGDVVFDGCNNKLYIFIISKISTHTLLYSSLIKTPLHLQSLQKL